MLDSKNDILTHQSESNENSDSFRTTVKSIDDTRCYFEERIDEVNEFFKYLEILSDRKTKIIQSDKKVHIEGDFLAILKSNGILLLYNLIESTVRFLIENIFHDISIRQCHFDELNSVFKEAIFKNLKDISPENSIKRLLNVSFDIIQLGCNPKKDFSGNIDIRKIKEIGKKYGIIFRFQSLEADPNFSSEFKQNLQTVKIKRNDLSHGNLTFIECGKGTSLEKLNQYRQSTESSLRSLFGEIENYICEQGYLKENK
ncbi:MAG: hypothetical protein COB67_04940 [SAR324 cluster bacterium]|uniref:MAE-28990/MAE-18760-like HEPN domain-containing protein n=1 Tax=SAR324 cluster bacterium TaxID=2024889 RepID=A0A2A4T622_9DELT|nr:MAG: hypothetical protein COB67_04940 [SAR324 cluster bacterium]